jgi:hypothetical protein
MLPAAKKVSMAGTPITDPINKPNIFLGEKKVCSPRGMAQQRLRNGRSEFESRQGVRFFFVGGGGKHRTAAVLSSPNIHGF